MLSATRDTVKQQYHEYLKKIGALNNELKDTLTPEDYNIVKNATEKSRENRYKKESQRLKEKFDKLSRKETSQSEEKRPSKLKDEVYDLTKDGIDDEVKEYLKLGPDFSITPRRLPYEKVIIETEKMCDIIEKEKDSNTDQATELEREAHQLREKVKHLLKKQTRKKIKSNLTLEEENGRERHAKTEKESSCLQTKGKSWWRWIKPLRKVERIAMSTKCRKF